VLTLVAVAVTIGIPLQAIAAMFLAGRRGSGWATWGGAAMLLGTGLQVTGVAGWAAFYYFATDPTLDPAAAQGLFRTVGDDLHLIGVAAVAIGYYAWKRA